MVYQLNADGRFTGETYNRTMQDYIDTGFIPRITDIAPPEALPDHEVMFNGCEWIQMSFNTDPKHLGE